ncbi:hypothetical protein CP556_08365 [Natrinema sp. CBA1119]|uniref:hypothetical protein n=1 Tax=Natrinema sp. CBA1119 TaxID=1608465 RepID=UPI000BF36EAB|nr:hypothetical protein [Natrinema sp. CBA1119]PGF16131.1 hypothetical protein CP556_08365 [Natrinema sp. CBA1119]
MSRRRRGPIGLVRAVEPKFVFEPMAIRIGWHRQAHMLVDGILLTRMDRRQSGLVSIGIGGLLVVLSDGPLAVTGSGTGAALVLLLGAILLLLGSGSLLVSVAAD